MTQFFNKTGYTSTKTGWKNDVYQLATTKQEIYDGNGNDICLYTRIFDIHKLYVKERETLSTEEERLTRYQTYQEDILRIREEHILKLRLVFEFAVKNEWLIYKEPSQALEPWFNREENLRWKILVTSALLLCYWVSITGIYNKITMQEAVSQGLQVLDGIQGYAWFCFISFIVLEVVYFHSQIITILKSMGSMCGWLFGGCDFDMRIETRFDTPHWDMCPVVLA